MLVARHMTRDPVTVGQFETLAAAREKMEAGGFRRLPVVDDGRLIGMVTDRDLREHHGYLKETKVTGAMREDVVTVSPSATLESATQRMIERRVGGLPVVEEGKLVGIITVTDVLKAFLDVMGATDESTARLDLVLQGSRHDLGEVARIIADGGGEVLGLGTHRETWDERPVFFVRLRASDPETIADALLGHGYEVLGVHRSVSKRDTAAAIPAVVVP
ncbi:MAG: CBS domain-containing protein [Candidatus Binatia bacterium]